MYNNIREKLERELENISKKENYSGSDIDYLKKLTGTIKNLDIICCNEDEYSRGNMNDAYDNGHSYRHYVRGHYSRDNDYSQKRDYSRSREREGDSINELEHLMREATSEREREALRIAIDMLNK